VTPGLGSDEALACERKEALVRATPTAGGARRQAANAATTAMAVLAATCLGWSWAVVAE
jgi:hypothetical protein